MTALQKRQVEEALKHLGDDYWLELQKMNESRGCKPMTDNPYILKCFELHSTLGYSLSDSAKIVCSAIKDGQIMSKMRGRILKGEELACYIISE